MKSGHLAAEIYMKGGFEIMRIEPRAVFITSDLWVEFFGGHMWTAEEGLDSTLKIGKPRARIDDIVADITNILEEV